MISFKEHIELDEAADAGLAAKASKSGISIGTLRKVYRRGIAAWNSGHRPGTTPQQWGMARVNSYISKGKGTYGGADKDLHEEEILEGDTSKLPRVTKDKESGLPKKYVAGLSASTAKARAAHWEKMDKLSDSNPAAYAPAPGDATAKTKESKYTKKYHAMYGESMDEEIFEACWVGYKQVGVKKKGSKMVPNCVPEELELQFDMIEEFVDHLAETNELDSETVWESLEEVSDEELLETAANWAQQAAIAIAKKKSGKYNKEGKRIAEDAKGYKNPTGGLTQKGRDYYNNKFGGHLKAPVTTPPSKLKAGSKAANRRKSFCARMSGVQGPMKKPNGEPTRKALALRKWNC
jgi:hypothetical protein